MLQQDDALDSFHYSSLHLSPILLGFRDCHLPPQIIYLLCLHEVFRDLGRLCFLKQWGSCIKIECFASSYILLWYWNGSVIEAWLSYGTCILIQDFGTLYPIGKKKECYQCVVSISYSLTHCTDYQPAFSVHIQVAQDLLTLLTFKYQQNWCCQSLEAFAGLVCDPIGLKWINVQWSESVPGCVNPFSLNRVFLVHPLSAEAPFEWWEKEMKSNSGIKWSIWWIKILRCHKLPGNAKKRVWNFKFYMFGLVASGIRSVPLESDLWG